MRLDTIFWSNTLRSRFALRRLNSMVATSRLHHVLAFVPACSSCRGQVSHGRVFFRLRSACGAKPPPFDQGSRGARKSTKALNTAAANIKAKSSFIRTSPKRAGARTNARRVTPWPFARRPSDDADD
jgi:hypothetical protein